jgi:hypothetical protein
VKSPPRFSSFRSRITQGRLTRSPSSSPGAASNDVAKLEAARLSGYRSTLELGPTAAPAPPERRLRGESGDILDSRLRRSRSGEAPPVGAGSLDPIRETNGDVAPASTVASSRARGSLLRSRGGPEAEH